MKLPNWQRCRFVNNVVSHLVLRIESQVGHERRSSERHRFERSVRHVGLNCYLLDYDAGGSLSILGRHLITLSYINRAPAAIAAPPINAVIPARCSAAALPEDAGAAALEDAAAPL